MGEYSKAIDRGDEGRIVKMLPPDKMDDVRRAKECVAGALCVAVNMLLGDMSDDCEVSPAVKGMVDKLSMAYLYLDD